MRKLTFTVFIGLLVGTLAGTGDAGAAEGGPDGDGRAEFKAEEVVGRTECRDGATSAWTMLTGEVSNRLEEVHNRYYEEDGYRGTIWDGREVKVVVAPESLEKWGSLGGGTAPVIPSCVPEALLTGAYAALDEFDVDADSYVAVGYDVLRDTVMFESTFPVAEVVSAISRKSGIGTLSVEEAVEGRSVLRVREVVDGFGKRAASRLDDIPPFYGGGRIIVDLNVGFKECTFGFYVTSPIFGTSMVTAGHCGDHVNADVMNGNSSESAGFVLARSYPNPDLMLVDGEAYAPRTYSWNDWTTNRPIKNALEPVTGSVYCQFGARSQRRCFAFTSLSVTLVSQAGNTTNLAYTEGPVGPGQQIARAGDSGGGVFKAGNGYESARGIVVAADCDATKCMMVAHKLSTIRGFFGAEVVLSP